MGCSKEDEGAEMNIYYIDTDANALVECEFERTQTDVDESVKEVIKALYTSKEMNLQSPIPKGVDLLKPSLVSFTKLSHSSHNCMCFSLGC